MLYAVGCAQLAEIREDLKLGRFVLAKAVVTGQMQYSRGIIESLP